MRSRLWCFVGLLLAGGSAQASLYPLPTDGSAVVGKDSNVTTVYEDTLPDIAHRYSLGYYEIIRANPAVDVWLPGPGLLSMGRGGQVSLLSHRAWTIVRSRHDEWS